MELVTAPTLADILNQAGALPEDRVLTPGVRILAALGLLSRHDIPGERVDSAILSPDKHTLATTSYDNGVYLWRVSR